MKQNARSVHILLLFALIQVLPRLCFDCSSCRFCVARLCSETPSKVITNMPDGLRSLSCIMGLFIHHYLLSRILLDVWRPLVAWPDVCLCIDMSGA